MRRRARCADAQMEQHCLYANGVQQPLHAKTPSHTSFSVFQMLLILL
jgi:hypothetical protein